MNIVLKENNFPEKEGYYIIKTSFWTKPEIVLVGREPNGKLYLFQGNGKYFLETGDKYTLFSDEIFFGGEP